MVYNITLPLPEGWTCITDSYQEFDGSEVTHLDARLADERTQRDKAFINIYVGPMPPDTSAEDEALANYADMVGWSDDDDDEDPIIEWPFNGRKAYGFDAWCEDETPMRVLCVEVRKGVLCIMSLGAQDDAALLDLVALVEHKLRIK
jgi:hypothetical protein